MTVSVTGRTPEIWPAIMPGNKFHNGAACDNPPCVRPDHLFLGTPADNMADMAAKARGNTARLTPDDVRSIRAAHAAGESLSRIAERFGMAKSSVAAAANGQTWRLVR